MSIKTKLMEDMKEAMKNKEKSRLTIIRMANAEIKNAEIRERKELTEEQLIAVVNKVLKETKESLEVFSKSDRVEKTEELKYWVEILTSYLPEQLSEDEVRSLISQIIVENNLSGKQSLGTLMKLAMPKLKGKADGKVVNQVASELLG